MSFQKFDAPEVLYTLFKHRQFSSIFCCFIFGQCEVLFDKNHPPQKFIVFIVFRCGVLEKFALFAEISFLKYFVFFFNKMVPMDEQAAFLCACVFC